MSDVGINQDKATWTAYQESGIYKWTPAGVWLTNELTLRERLLFQAGSSFALAAQALTRVGSKTTSISVKALLGAVAWLYIKRGLDDLKFAGVQVPIGPDPAWEEAERL